MITTTLEQAQDEFVKFAMQWFGLISQGSLAEACRLIDLPNTFGERFDEQSLSARLSSYPPLRSAAVSHPNQTTGRPHVSTVALRDGSGYSFNIDVPVNGEWSDLTAQFEFIRSPAGYSVILHDLHVM